MKSEPYKYPWVQLLKDKSTFWDGVRNYQARNNLRAMEIGDQCFFYHSNEDKAIMGIAEVIKASYQDPSTLDPNWVSVDIAPIKTLDKPVTLAAIKANPELAMIGIIKQSRLSVVALKPEEFEIIFKMSKK